MNLRSNKTTFNTDEIWIVTKAMFVDTLKINSKEIEVPFSKPNLFSFYENNISYPIDDLKDGERPDRVDFYELVSLMSWAFFRVWSSSVIEYSNLDLDMINKEKVLKLFMDNLNCEEGETLIKKLSV